MPTVYGSALVLSILKRKLKEHQDVKATKFVEVTDDFIIKSKYFNIDFFRVCHSIPLCFGVCLQTPNANIVTCGDFRFDFFKKMEQTNIHKICEIAQRKIDILLCETTNAQAQGFGQSEKYILDEVKRQIANAKGRVFVTTFASNLHRIENIIEIAINLKRKICIIGKSMDANIKASIQIGLLKTYKHDFVEPVDIKNTPDKELLIILTGSQGEPTAVLNMMATGKYPHIILKPSDLLLMSSNPIPGNYQQVEQLLNRLYKTGIHIVVNNPKHKLHISGHATQTELALMVKLINPKYIIPIHGEYKMLSAMEANVQFLGLEKENYLQISNGQIVEILNHKVTVTNHFIDTNEVYVDDNKMNIDSSKVMSARRILGSDGIFNVTIVLDRSKGKVIGLPMVITRGCFYVNAYISLVKKICYSIKENLEKQMTKIAKPLNNLQIRKIVSETISYFI